MLFNLLKVYSIYHVQKGIKFMNDTLVLLGKQIANLRSKKGLTQEKLAELVNYSPNHISKLESARTNPSFELLVNIAKALDIELKELFNFDEFENINYIKQEFNKLLKSSDTKKIKSLYKIYKTL